MNKKLASCLLGAVAIVATIASLASACGDYGLSTLEWEGGVTQEDRLIAVNSEGSLISINRIWGTTRNYGRFDRKLLPKIDVRGDRVCIATETEVCEISLQTGKLVRSHKHSHGRCGVGIINARKVFLNNGRSIAIMDMASGATLRKIDLMANTFSHHSLTKSHSHIEHVRNGNLLYIARPSTRGIAVVDLKQGKRLQDLKPAGLTIPHRMHLSNDKLFVVDYGVSYGIRTEQLTTVDVKTGTIQNSLFLGDMSRDFFVPRESKNPTKMVGSENGGVLVSRDDEQWQFDNQGNLIR